MPSLDQVIQALMGVAFGARALDSRRPVWARAAYGAVGVDLLHSAYQGQPILPSDPLGRTVEGKVTRTATGETTVPLKFDAVKLRTNDIAERVAYIHKQAVHGTRDPQVYSLARAAVSKRCGDGWCIPERDHRGEATALFNEVRARVRYTFDPTDYDAFQIPAKTLALRTGDCDDQVALLGAMLRSIGLQVQSRVVHTQGFPTYNHIYLRCQIPESKQWMALDCTVDKPAGWEVPASSMVRPPRDFPINEKGSPSLT